MKEPNALRVGVIFGGRSSEHEVSLSSARNVMDALDQAGYIVIPIGITPQGRWLTGSDPLKQLADNEPRQEHIVRHMANGTGHSASEANGSGTGNWALLPSSAQNNHLPALDVIFPVLHGPYGEDGTVQGLLEMANLPYVGCGVLTSALAMDKAVAKQLFAVAGLPQVRAHVVIRKAFHGEPAKVLDDLESLIDYPLFVKPANLGSSVGISKARNRDELAEAIALAGEFDRKIVVEEAVPNAREIEVSVLGNQEAIASVPGEVLPGREFYDYTAKYLDDTSQLMIPAPLTDEQVAAVQSMAIRAFQAIDGSGLARVDFLMDGQTERFYLNELNTMPGFTRTSMYPKLWEASGISYPKLVDHLIRLAMERYEDRQQNRTTR